MEEPTDQFTLGKYQTLEVIGRGGFGTVYKAIDTSLDREVALKVLHPQLMADGNFVKYFKREAKTLASIDHPNILRIYEIGEVDNRLFIATELMVATLEDVIAEKGKYEFEEAFPLLKNIADGLHALHEKQIVHRDVKPSNILVNEKGQAVLGDLGLVYNSEFSSLHSSGSAMGTPSYKAPELWRGELATPKADIYAFGCVVYEMLTGNILFDGKTPDAIIARHLVERPNFDALPPKLRSRLAPAVAQVIDNRPERILDVVENIQFYKKSSSLHKVAKNQSRAPQNNDKASNYDNQNQVSWKNNLIIRATKFSLLLLMVSTVSSFVLLVIIESMSTSLVLGILFVLWIGLLLIGGYFAGKRFGQQIQKDVLNDWPKNRNTLNLTFGVITLLAGLTVLFMSGIPSMLTAIVGFNLHVARAQKTQND